MQSFESAMSLKGPCAPSLVVGEVILGSGEPVKGVQSGGGGVSAGHGAMLYT